MIIGISGLIGAGKDTIADYLVNFHGFRRESWAGTLKDAVANVFGWPRDLLEGRTAQARIWREQVDPWWSERLGLANLTPRWVLQYWGTEVCRMGFHDDIWTASLENRLRQTQDNVVISDCRFANELETIKRLGGITVRVVRGPDPEWVELYQRDWHAFAAQYPNVHASEYSSVCLDFDYILRNDGSVSELYDNVKDLLQGHRAAMLGVAA
jgi:hypothetical protein